ncbi:MAG: inorganic phosphate transporter [Acidobacteria bacterium]|nr:inorganic phosphate transporter [Acidobacteriota bacterium]
MSLSLLLAAIFLSYANGANDNFKGVATLFGSRTAGYRKTLFWATGTTFLGSLMAAGIARGMVETFRGEGLISGALSGSPELLLPAGFGAAATVFLATLAGLPVSTTHALTGGLLGAALAANAGAVNVGGLGTRFLAPLLVSPVAAVGITAALYPLLRAARRWSGLRRESCLCLGEEIIRVLPEGSHASVAAARAELTLTLGAGVECVERYRGRLVGIHAQKVLDACHFLSSGLVSLARGLNDTPKIVPLFLAAGTGEGSFGFLLAGAAMALGGLLSARRVAGTMSHRITPMNHGQGFTANLVTAFLVIGSSRLGLPVSTTHLSCGALFGIGLITGEARRRTVGAILLAWVFTLPAAALLAALLTLFVPAGN